MYPNGNSAFQFVSTASFDVTLSSSSTVTLQPGWAVSEISIFPVAGQCDQYYVMFWAHDLDGTKKHRYEIRAIKVTVDPSSFPSSITCTDGVMVDHSSATGYYDIEIPSFAKGELPFYFVLAPDAANPDGSRDIYTIDPGIDPVDHSWKSKMRKWTISSGGSLPTSAYTYYDHITTPYKYQTNAYSAKGKILNIGGTKYFAYMSGATGGDWITYENTRCPYFLNMYTLNNATSIADASLGLSWNTSILPSLSTTLHYELHGYEYIPAKNVIYFSYVARGTGGTITTGGLGYWDALGNTVFSSNSTSDYELSDLEINKHGDLLMVNGTSPSTTDGKLAYLNVSSSSFSPSAVITPTVITTSCSTYNNISVANIIESGERESQNYRGYYLGSQIRNENYNNWGRDVLAIYTVSSAETWTPEHNPVATALGTSVSEIGFKGIIIPAGASLTIKDMTIKIEKDNFIDVKAGITTTGGKLILNNTKITGYTPPCSSGPAIPMWGGIRVSGNSTKSQLPLGSSAQGYLQMSNNSEIQYAKIGVYVGQIELVRTVRPFFPGGLWTPAIVGGGIVQVRDSRFYNNTNGIIFMPYRNFSPSSPAAELPNNSYIYNTSFNSDNPAIVLSSRLVNIGGTSVKGIAIKGCDFRNGMGFGYNTFGIYGQNMGFTVDDYTSVASPVAVSNRFSNFDNAIFTASTSSNYTAAIRNSTFNDNLTGVYLRSTNSAAVTGNTFNVPKGAITYPIWPPVAAMVPETYGLILYTSSAFSVYGNKFQSSTIGHVLPFSSVNNSTGILAWNTGGDDNMITNNTFVGLANGNLANYRNRDGNNHGLWYRCNNNSYNKYDIASRGHNNNISTGDGIRNYQGLQLEGKPAANSFSVSCSDFNLYNLSSECAPYTYMTSTSPTPLTVPGAPCVTARNYNLIYLTTAPNFQSCALPGSGLFPTPPGGKLIWPLTRNMDGADQLLAKLNNITFYLTDSGGISHRDSLYYWVRQLQTPGGDRMIAGLLLEDGFTDSAIHQYDSIPLKYKLDKAENEELTTWGRQLFSIQAKLQRNMNVVRDLAISAADSATVDSVIRSLPVYLDSATVDTLTSVFINSKYWARIGAENIVLLYDAALFDSVLAISPDSILVPYGPDTTVLTPFPKGALAITEISQGPSSGCQYVEMIATHCGSSQQPYVDVSGWIIDDNSGNFNNSNCDVDYGVTPGHYRLAADNPVWQTVPIGSRIVLYNQGNNCYNLPDTFTIDSFNNIYWVPVPAQYSQISNVLERYYNPNSQNSCSYCADDGSTDYTNAYGWDQTLELASTKDAVQVRCPGCNASVSTPAFYQGIGYAPDGQGAMFAIPPGATSLGAQIVFNHRSTNMKYAFGGATAADLFNPQSWTVDSADTAGIRPSTLGFVSSALMDAITYHTETFPCCAVPQQRNSGSAHHPTPDTEVTNGTGNVRVFPNPANTTLNFEFAVSQEVTIRLTDVTGRIMAEQTVHNTGKASFNVKNYPVGLYLYQLTSNGKTTSGKVVIGE